MSVNIITPIAAVIVAACVAFISLLQWKTNREKLRLDLYNRRFEIYLAVLNFYQALMLWNGSEEQIALMMPFLRAYRESMFLFPAKSGVYDLLTEFHTHAFNVTQFDKLKPLWAGNIPELMAKTNERDKSAAWIVGSIQTLDLKMAPFLNFHKV